VAVVAAMAAAVAVTAVVAAAVIERHTQSLGSSGS
jgi:hypothetical protein